MNELAIHLTALDLALASLLVVVPAAISQALDLGLTRRLLLAALRTIVQLVVLGFVLDWVFAEARWYVVLALLAVMVANAGIAAVRRTERRFAGIWVTALVAVALSSVVTTAFVVEGIVGVSPWYEPRYVIPIAGMVLGISLNGLSLCLNQVMVDLDTKRAEVEGWLALGATSWEACRPHIRDAVRTGMIPVLNQMSVVGVVSLPGMMTGQIIAGADAIGAVKYQVIIMFTIASATSFASLLAVVLAFRRLVTPRHQLAHERLRRLP